MHAGRDLVDDDALTLCLFNEEHFDRDHADVVERSGNASCHVDGSLLCRGLGVRRYYGARENMVGMFIFADIKGCERAIKPACANHRDFALEGHEAFENAGAATHRGKSLSQIAALADHHLALAVITKAARFQDARTAKFGNCFFKISDTIDSRKRCGRNAEIIQKAFFGKAILGDGKRPRARSHGAARFQKSCRLCRHIFKFVRDHANAVSKSRKRFFIVISSNRMLRANVESRAGLGAINMCANSQACSSQCDHAAKLA